MPSKEENQGIEEFVLEQVKAQVDMGEIYRTLKQHAQEKPRKVIDHELVSNYRAYDAPDYQRGTFIDTQFRGGDIHDYHEMQQMLEELNTRYPGDTELLLLPESEGYGNPDNALPIVCFQLPATQKSERTVFFVSGHHKGEWSGSEATYLIAKRLLGSYHAGNSAVKLIRRDTHLTFIPQVDADLYANLPEAMHLGRDEYYELGYSRLGIRPNDVELNRYREFNASDFLSEQHIFEQTRAVMSFCEATIAQHGPPLLVIDYHEGPSCGKFEALQDQARVPPRHLPYIYAEVAKSYPVINELELAENQVFLNEFLLISDMAETFSEYMACRGAYGILLEAPKEEHGYSLDQRIEMDLIATDRILAQHYLDL